jgi:4-aminobutyrate aminotransferase-like enzyme
MWYSAVSFGYGNARLNEALKKQIDTLPQLACQYLHEEKIKLASKLAQRIEMTFESEGRVHFNVGGSAAIEDSLKVVRSHTGRNLVFAFMGGYHGRTLGASAITSSYRYREKFGHFSDRALFIPYPYCFRCPYDQKRGFCDLFCIRQFEKLFETEYHAVINKKTNKSEFGAFYIEPVQGTGGYIVPPQEYFFRLKEILDRYNILLVDDEVQMGFFRTGKFWAIEHFNIVPDVIVFGKALTNGLNPLSGIWAKEKLISPSVFPPGSTHSTFSSNPLGTAVGLEVMKLIEESDFAVTVQKKGEYFISRLMALRKKYPQIGDVSGLGLAIRIEICQKDGFTPNRELTDAIADIGLSGKLEAGGKKRGLVLDVGGYYKNVFTLAPSLYITEEEINLAVDLFEEALKKGIALVN